MAQRFDRFDAKRSANRQQRRTKCGRAKHEGHENHRRRRQSDRSGHRRSQCENDAECDRKTNQLSDRQRPRDLTSELR